MNDCPHFSTSQREFFENKIILNDHNWDPDKLIDFSYLPGINEALEGDSHVEWYDNQSDHRESSDAEEADISGDGDTNGRPVAPSSSQWSSSTSSTT